MPRLISKYFGELDYSPDSAFDFPAGIPGFEQHRSFVFVEQPHTDPLVFMHSLLDPELCLLTVPVFVADPEYILELAPDEAAALGLTPGDPVQIGGNVLCLAVVTVTEGAAPTANLAAPVVLHLENHVGVQAVQDGGRYSLRHPITAEETVPCS